MDSADGIVAQGDSASTEDPASERNPISVKGFINEEGQRARGVPTARGLKLKQRLLSSPYEIDIERARSYTKAWREAESGEATAPATSPELGPCMKAALALRETLRTMSIRIEEDELLVGVKTAKPLAGVIPVERGEFNTVLEVELDRLTRRKRHRFHIGERERRELMQDILPYWKGRTARSRKIELWKEWGVYDTSSPGPGSLGRVLRGMGTKKALKMGKMAMGGSLKSVSKLPEMMRELAGIADRCRRVPARPPRTFLEALQCIWMTQAAMCISYGMAEILSLGRVDQYLYPYYRADLEAGRITRTLALEAIEDLYVKLATFLIMLVEIGKETASEMGVGSNTITIGGLDREGRDATNEVSHLLLEAHENLRALANNLCVRISAKTPPAFLAKACASHRFTSGMAFFNDELIVGELTKDGYALADARDYSIVGCVEPTSTGSSFACTAGNDISLAAVLEMALGQGRALLSGGRVGEATPDPRTFRSFEEVKEAFARQLAFNVRKLARAVEAKDRAHAEAFPNPLVSATLEGCLESATDMTRGGARYNYGSITGRGLGTVADSLAAIRWAVFERRMLSMDELLHHLASDFREDESLRAELATRAPKYGRDDPAADELARWVTESFCAEVRKHACGRGGFYRPGIFSYGVHVADGMTLGATPDGRKAGMPVSNGISPVNGTEMAGPTAVMHSAAAAGGSLLSDGTALNLRLSPSLIATGEGAGKMASLVEGYFALGGRHVQFNVVDTATLRDAQAHPERYPDLVVRVSGYCAYFTDLGRSIQNDIISRTEFDHL